MIKRWEISLALGMVFAILLSAVAAFAGDCAEVRREVVRLHVLANSDSEEDQALKLVVRDAVLESSEAIFTAPGGHDAVEALAAANLEEIQAAAQQRVYQLGYTYPVSAEIVNMYFETRLYGNVALPAGRYDAVRIVIGAGEGQNWWCVLFPPMCIPAVSQGEAQELEERIGQLGTPVEYTPKFAIVELFESIGELF